LNEPAEALSACGTDRGSQLVKRVVGLPGDRVVVANNILTIFNKQHPNGFDPDKTLQYQT
jgi:signal peptidase I